MRNKKVSTNGRAGVALLLVLMVLAFAAILGFAMLSAASLQAQTTSNSSLAMSADALADSGIELGCYYLVNPAKAPKTVTPGGYYDGGTITFGANMPGSVELTITPLVGGGAGDYKIVSVGKAAAGAGGADSGNTLAHTLSAAVHVDTGWTAKSLLGLRSGGTLSSTSTINGDVQSNAQLSNSGKIMGTVISPLTATGGTIAGGTVAPSATNKMTIPLLGNLPNLSSYSYRGKTYSAVAITSLPTGTTLGPTETNPAGVYRFVGTLTMNHNVTLNGTLLVEGGDLNISGGGNRITPVDGFPALVAKNNIYVRGPLLPSTSPRDLTVNGVVWVGGALKSSGILTYAFVEVNGAMLFGGSGSVDINFGAKLTVNANANKTTNINIDTTVPPAGATVLSYK